MSFKTTLAGLMVGLMTVAAPVVWADTAATPAPAEASHHDGDWHHHGHDQMTAKILNLSEDQEKQLKASRENQMKAMKDVFKQMKANRESFEAEIAKATPDMTVVTRLQTEIKTIQAQMVDNRLNSLLEIKKILNPEQFAGYMALEKEKMMHKGRHQMGHDRDHKHWGDKNKAEGDEGHDGPDQE